MPKLSYREIEDFLVDEGGSATFGTIVSHFEKEGFTKGQVNGRLRDGLTKRVFRQKKRGTYSVIESQSDLIIDQIEELVNEVEATLFTDSIEDLEKSLSLIESLKEIVEENRD